MYSHRHSNLADNKSIDDLMHEKDAPNCDYILQVIPLMHKFFLGKESVSPIFLFKKDDAIMPVRVPADLLGNEESKEELSLLIKTLVDTYKPESFCLISEAWLYKVNDCENPEEANQIISDYKKGIKNPKLVSEECVVFHYTEINPDNSSSRWMGSMPIHRGADENISKFGTVKWIHSDGNKQILGKFAF